MSWLTKGLAKALSALRHPGAPHFHGGLMRRTQFDYAREVGTGIDASVVMAPVQWIQRAAPEARLRVMRGQGADRREVDNHPLVQLVARPNPFYSETALVSGTVFSYCTAGYSYWIKVRNGAGRVVELWYVPHWSIEPKWPRDGSDFLSHYEYRPGGGQPPVRLEPEDVVHFRHGIDPRNPRQGLSPLAGVLREIFTDLESSNFVAALLRNMGVPGVVISPDGGVSVAPDDVEATKKWFGEAFGGDRRGAPLVMGGATKVSTFGFNPQQMDLSVTRDVAEERVCASLGVPAAVVGFGAGLQTAKVGATMGELRKLAWTNGVLPLLRSFADEVERSLAELLSAGDQVGHDTDGVAALAEDRLTQAQQWAAGVTAGAVLVSEFREAMGLDVDDSHRIFLRPFSAVEVANGAPPRLPAPPPALESRAIDMTGLIGKGTKADRAPPARLAGLRGYVRALSAMEAPLQRAFEPRLKGFFEGLGRASAEAARPLLEEAAAAGPGDAKADATPEDEILARRIIERLGLEVHRTAFQRLYEAHYLQVAGEIAKAGELIGLAAGLPDPVARSVLAAGGRRSGLVDLADQSRRALFDALAEGRAAGEGVDALAARIGEHVSAGPWTTAEQRARTIARTETKFAQNTSTIARAQEAGVQRFVVFDGRFGLPRSTPSHVERDGLIVTADQAASMAADEHPNGTLSFAPYIEET